MTNRTRLILIAALYAALAALGTGCATVKPWDRDLLSQKKMQFAPPQLLNTIDEHVYFSKEGSTGGLGVAGGGCGCN